MESAPTSKWWPLRSRQNFVFSSVALTACLVAAFVFSGSPVDQPHSVAEALPLLAVIGVGGVTWGLVIWAIFFQPKSR